MQLSSDESQGFAQVPETASLSPGQPEPRDASPGGEAVGGCASGRTESPHPKNSVGANASSDSGEFIYNATMADLDPAAPSGAPGAKLSLTSNSLSSAGTALAATGSAREPVPTLPSEPAVAATTANAVSMRARLLTLADGENQQAQRLAQQNSDFKLRTELLGTAVPNKYMELVDGLRSAVRAFNASLVEIPEQPLTHIKWYESPNIALRDAVTGDGMRVRVSRLNSYFDLVLRMVSRSGKSDIPLIEGYGSIGRELIRTETLMRIEGWVENGQVKFWVSLDFKRIALPIDELPDRIVMAVASHDYALISRQYGSSPAPRKSESEDAE